LTLGANADALHEIKKGAKRIKCVENSHPGGGLLTVPLHIKEPVWVEITCPLHNRHPSHTHTTVIGPQPGKDKNVRGTR
jgi:hypothetical protein